MRALSLALVLLATAADAQTRYQWVGGSSGAWSEPSNWSPAGVPAAADTAIVGEEIAAPRYATLTEPTTVAGLHLIGQGGLSGDADLTVTSEFVWAAGAAGLVTFLGTGTITNAATSTLRMTEPAPRFEMAADRTLVNDGVLVWDGLGAWRGTGRLVNHGELRLAMDETDAFGFAFSSLADALTNSETGVIRRTGSGEALLQAGLVNDGRIRIEAGSLAMSGFNATGTTGSGTVEIADGAELRIPGSGAHTQASVTGNAVTVSASNRQLTVTGTYDVTTTRIVGTGGGLDLDGDATTADLVMEGGVLGGSGTLSVTGSLDWTGGTMLGSGTTVLGPAVPLTIGGTMLRIDETRTLRTEGPVSWTGEADLQSSSTEAVFENAGTLTSSGAGERQTAFVTFRNTGTLVHDGGVLRFGGPVLNDGDVRIDDGTVRFGTSATDTGRYTIGETGRMEYVFGTQTLAPGSEVVGTGTVAFLDGTQINGATWRPGASPGTLTIDSDWLAATPEAVLEMEVGGTVPGTDFDQIVVNGTVFLGGTIRVTLTDGFVPADEDRFLIIPATGGAMGSFDAVEIPASPAGYVQATSEGVVYGIGTPVDADETSGVPTTLALHPPAPNPTRGQSTVAFDLPQPTAARIAVYDALGREVAVLLDAHRPAGTHTVPLPADAFPSGLYLLRLDAGDGHLTRSVTIAR